jgi:hypothetical protein
MPLQLTFGVANTRYHPRKEHKTQGVFSILNNSITFGPTSLTPERGGTL